MITVQGKVLKLRKFFRTCGSIFTQLFLLGKQGSCWLKHAEKNSAFAYYTWHRMIWKRFFLWLIQWPKLYQAYVGAFEGAFAYILYLTPDEASFDYYLGCWQVAYHFREEIEHDIVFVGEAHNNNNLFLRLFGFFLFLLTMIVVLIVPIFLTLWEGQIAIYELLSYLWFFGRLVVFGVHGCVFWELLGIEIPISTRTRLANTWEKIAYSRYCNDVLEVTDYEEKQKSMAMR